MLNEEIIAVVAAVVASEFIASARLGIDIGDLSGIQLDTTFVMLIDALADGLVTDTPSSIGVDTLTSANVNVLGAAMTAWECSLLSSSPE